MRQNIQDSIGNYLTKFELNITSDELLCFIEETINIIEETT